MDATKKIETYQDYCGKTICFEPDCSPNAWDYYRKIYMQNGYLQSKYKFDELVFYKHAKREDGFNYKNELEENKYNRLFVLSKQTKIKFEGGMEYFKPEYRLGGECDFNFNEKKCKLLKNIIDNDVSASDCEKKNALEQLKKCHQRHHTLSNFSLMQSVGDLQGFKGSNRFDRFDTFISDLNDYYHGISNSVLQSSTSANRSMLISFLNDFKDIYEYCAIFYLLDDKSFIDRIIKEGSMPISNVCELTRYMTLAEKYWRTREFNYKSTQSNL